MNINEVLIASANAIAGHGFADEFGDIESPEGWNGLATVSPVLLRNIGEVGLADTFQYLMGNAVYLVWIRIDSQGFKFLTAYVPSGTPAEDTILREWDEAQAKATA
jgi:hypothetical protein